MKEQGDRGEWSPVSLLLLPSSSLMPLLILPKSKQRDWNQAMKKTEGSPKGQCAKRV